MQEPYETLILDIENEHQGKVMESLGDRRGELQEMQPDGKGRTRLQFRIPSRGVMGYRPGFYLKPLVPALCLLLQRASAPSLLMTSAVAKWRIDSNAQGKAVSFALFNLQNRGNDAKPNDVVYEGMIVGIHSRANDLTVNPLKEKKLTNIRASGSDEAIILTNALQFTLEQALEFIDDDELVEVTPVGIRIRKVLLKEHERKRA